MKDEDGRNPNAEPGRLWLSCRQGRAERIGFLPRLYLPGNYRDSRDVTQGGGLHSAARNFA